MGVSDVPVAPIISISDGEAERMAIAALKDGGVIAFPTDTLYGLGCAFSRRRAIERLARLRGIDRARRPLTFVLPDVGEIARYAQVSSEGCRILNRILPGAFCVELTAKSGIPEPFVVGRHRAIGVRVPRHAFCERVSWGIGEPLLTATAKTPEGRTLETAAEIALAFGDELDLIVDGGRLAGAPSTVVSLVDDWVTVLRHGRGDPDLMLG
jgi:tRNA threonylcarbamoyl adenosine modification protein (Sua5/YciO/YrdC/YwlC family)